MSGEAVLAEEVRGAPQRASASTAAVDLAEAHLLVWFALGVLDFAIILTDGAAPLGTRLLLAAFDFGQLAAIAIAGHWLLRALAGYGASAALAALTVFSVVVGAFWIAPDFRNFAVRHDWPELWPAFGVGAGLLVPVVAVVGRLAARPWLRWACAVVAAATVVANHFVLQADYRGIHLLASWGAASFATVSVWGAVVRVPRAVRLLQQLRARHLRLALVALLLPCLVALMVLPPQRVLIQGFRTEGAVLFPFLVSLHGDEDVATLAARSDTRVAESFLNPRDRLPPIPASTPRLAPQQPIVVLLTIDAMRAELLAKAEYRRRLPRLASFSDESVSFTRARSPGSTTRNSLAQLFASKYSAQLRWSVKKGMGANLTGDETPRFSDRLAEAGFVRVHISAYGGVLGKHRIVGSFDHEVRVESDVKRQRFALSSAMVDAALRRLDEHAAGPTFLFMHWMDAHDPYDANGKEGDVLERYVREVELCDRSLGRLIDGLRERGLWDRTILVATADHGEALGDHGIPHHGFGLYESLVRVPLMVRVPGVRPRRVKEPVTTLDLAPTLLDLLGLPTPGEYMGQSLMGFLRGGTPKLERPIAFDQSRERQRGIILGSYKIIDDKKKHTVEIYDMEKDPKEEQNLLGKLPDGRDEQLLRELRGFFSKRTEKGRAEVVIDD